MDLIFFFNKYEITKLILCENFIIFKHNPKIFKQFLIKTKPVRNFIILNNFFINFIDFFFIEDVSKKTLFLANAFFLEKYLCNYFLYNY